MKQRVYIFTTFACSMRCPRCYQRKLPSSEPMTPEAFQRIWERLAEQQCEVGEWVFTGGEPILWLNLIGAVKKAKQYPFGKSKVRIVSNGLNARIEDYGEADTIQITDYGAINRIDLYRLKTASRRVKIQNAIHWDWNPNEKGAKGPGECGCTGLSFVGNKVWPCAMAAAAQTGTWRDIEKPFHFPDPHHQDFCRYCLVNRKNRKAPKPVVQIGIWESKSVIIG